MMEQKKKIISLSKAIGAGFFAGRIVACLICVFGLILALPIALHGGALSVELPDYGILFIWVLCIGFLLAPIWFIFEMVSVRNGKICIYRDKLLEAGQHYRPATVRINGYANNTVFKMYFESLYNDFGYEADMSSFFEMKAEKGKEYYVVLFRGEVKNFWSVDEYELSPSLMNCLVRSKEELSAKTGMKIKTNTNESAPTA